jgi:hypothetical protein
MEADPNFIITLFILLSCTFAVWNGIPINLLKGKCCFADYPSEKILLRTKDCLLGRIISIFDLVLEREV